MSTKLLHQVREQDQAELAAKHNGETRQSSRVWVVKAFRAEITEAEWFAATRAIEDFGSLYAGKEQGAGFQMYVCPVTGMLTSGKEQSQLRQTAAMQARESLRQGVVRRCSAENAANCVEWIAAYETLEDVTMHLGWWRNKGKDRAPSPDKSRVKPFVRLVLLAMAAYYEDCGRTEAA
jgi:hypothetical protein